jgi:FkbM family methyltransferase
MPGKSNASTTRLLFRCFGVLERRCGYGQGKGYGTATIRREVAFVRKLLGRRPALAVDIGGNIGDYTAELARNAPDLEIHVFEPAPTNVVKLGQRFAATPGITVVPYGVSDVAGAATLHANEPGSGLASLTKRNLAHFNIEFEHADAVQVLRFEDYWLGPLAGRRVDIVKLDIEGHELAALQGFGRAIQHVAVLQFEFGGSNIDTRTFFRDFWLFFERTDFDLYRITPFGLEAIERYRESDESFSVTNFIAANRGLA